MTPSAGDPPPSRASLLTPAGRGAVAVIAASGPAALATVDAHFAAANGLRIGTQPINRIVFGHWFDGAHREEVVVCRTAEAELEVHCHGGVAAAERILAALAAAGCPIEPWGEWRRGSAASVLRAEADIALASAGTVRTAAILLEQRHGALQREVAAIQTDLAAAELSGRSAAGDRLAQLLGRASLGLHLTQPWRVAIAGRPNVGKSSLINALVGYQRSIVFDQPGTTRDVLAAETAIDGWPVRLTDAAGLRAPADELEAAGVELAKDQLTRANLVVWVLDATTLTLHERAEPEPFARRQIAVELGGAFTGELLVVVNKIDLVAETDVRPGLTTSALTGRGLESLLAAIGRRLVTDPPIAGAGVPFTTRQTDLLHESALALAAGDALAASASLADLIGSAPAPSS